MQRPLKQKTIGILGGMSDKATAEYYRMINEAVNKKLGGWDIAETIIAGVNFGNIEYFVRNNKWQEIENYLESKSLALQAAGADVIISVSNTVHKVLPAIMQRNNLNFLHIVDPTAKAIQDGGLKKLAILGTKPVMGADYIKDRYRENFGIEVFSPNEDQQQEVDRVIFDELVKGSITEASKAKYLSIVDELEGRGAQGVILGCTEIFLLIQQADRPEFPLFNTTELHAQAVVDLI